MPIKMYLKGLLIRAIKILTIQLWEMEIVPYKILEEKTNEFF